MEMAHNFGAAIRKKFMADIYSQIGIIQVPGNFPHKEIQMLSGIVPTVNEALCSRCDICAPVCPTKAIDEENPMSTANELCIRCCACIKVCPSSARYLDDSRIKQASEWLHANFSTQKEPELYL
jgi:ferredoxin